MSESPRVRLAWFVAGGIATVGMLGFGTVTAIGLVAREDRIVNKEYDPADIDIVEVFSDNGSVRVFGDAESSIRVTIEISEGVAGIDETATVRGNRLALSSTCPGFWATFCEADYEIHVPPGTRVIARSDNGDAAVSGVDGGATVRSSNGDVTAGRLGGTVILGTSNGAIRATALRATEVDAESANGDVELDFDVAPGDVDAHSSNGDVEVRVPRGDELYAVDATTDNGEADTPVRTDPAGERRVKVRSSNGDVSLRYR